MRPIKSAKLLTALLFIGLITVTSLLAQTVDTLANGTSVGALSGYFGSVNVLYSIVIFVLTLAGKSLGDSIPVMGKITDGRIRFLLTAVLVGIGFFFYDKTDFWSFVQMKGETAVFTAGIYSWFFQGIQDWIKQKSLGNGGDEEGEALTVSE